MAIMLNPNAIPKGSITQEMIDASAFEGIYELLTAGYALNLVGKGNGEPQAFMSRKTGGGNITDGSAVIKEVDGVQPIVWNQLALPFSSTDIIYSMTASLSGNKTTFAAQPSGSTIFANARKEMFVVGHKYAIRLFYTPAQANAIRVFASTRDISSFQKIGIEHVAANSKKEITAVFTTQYEYLTIYPLYETASDGASADVEYYLIDLTQMFGAGNEPSTYEEYLDRISHYHIEDAYAYNAGEVVNYKGVGIKTTNVDGTKTYVRDWSEVMEKYFPDGMTSLNGVKDFFDDKRAVRKWGCKVFDGTEVWARGGIHFYVQIKENMAGKGYNTSLKCAMYTQASSASEYANDKIISAVSAYYEKNIIINDSAFTSTEAWKQHLADLYAQGNPLVVYYELAEPVEDVFDKPLNLTYTVINGGTETSLATENSTQFEGSIFYGKDYVGVIDELQLQNRVTQIEFENWEN